MYLKFALVGLNVLMSIICASLAVSAEEKEVGSSLPGEVHECNVATINTK